MKNDNFNFDFDNAFDFDFKLNKCISNSLFQRYIDYMLHTVCALLMMYIIYMNFNLCAILMGMYAVYRIAYSVYDVNNICPGVGLGADAGVGAGSSRLSSIQENDEEISNSLENLCSDDWVKDGNDSDTIHCSTDDEAQAEAEAEAVDETKVTGIRRRKPPALASGSKAELRPTLTLNYSSD